MAKNEELNKWIEAMTPRRAIDNFFDHATPVDSPELDEIFEPLQKLVPPEEEVITPVVSSQSSQRSRVQKRKLIDKEQPKGNVSKINSVDETLTHSLQNDSIFGNSEIPSSLESPSLVTPLIPTKKNKKRMSVSAFAKAIQSQQSQVINTSDDMGESNIPSALGSPDELLSQRPLKSKKRTSTSMFQETLGGKNIQDRFKKAIASHLDESGLESSDIPSNLESPEYVSSQNRSIYKSKSRMSTTTFKQMLEDQQEQDSEEIPSSLESPEKKQQVNRLVNKSKTRMSTTAFKKALEDQKEQDSVEIPSSLPSPEPKQEVSRLANKSKSQMLTKSVIKDQKEQDSGEIPSSLESPGKKQQVNLLVNKTKTRMSTTAFKKVLLDQEEQDSVEIPSSLESPDKKQEDNRLVNKSKSQMSTTSFIKATESQKEQDSGEIPSSLESPDKKQQANRLVNKFKTRVSTTAFQKALEDQQKERVSGEIKISETLLETPPKASDSDLSDDSNMPELESPNDFSPSTSSTQIIKSKHLMSSGSTVEPREAAKEPSHQFQSLKKISIPTSISSISINNSTAEIPSILDSPQEYKQYSRPRPGPASSKKRVSTTGFLTALSQKNDISPSSESPVTGHTLKTPNVLVFNRSVNLTAVTSPHATPHLVDEEIEEKGMVSRTSSRASNKSSSSLKNIKRSAVPLSDLDNDPDEANDLFEKSVSSVIKEINKSLRSASRASNKSSTATKSNDRNILLSKSDDSDSDDSILSRKSATPPVKDTGKMSRSSSRASYKSLLGNDDVVLKNANKSTQSTTSRKTPSPLAGEMRNISRSSSTASQSSSSSNVIKRKKIPRPDSDEDDGPILNQLSSPTIEGIGNISRSSSRASYNSLPETIDEALNSSNRSKRSSTSRKTSSPLVEEIENIPRSLSRTSESSLSSNVIERKTMIHPESDGDDDPLILNQLPSSSTRHPNKSLPTFSRVIFDSESESESEESENLLSKQIMDPISTKTPSPVIAPIDEAKASSSLSSGSRSRRYLKFDSLTTKDDASMIPPIVDDLPLLDEAEVEETPPSGDDSIEEEEKSTDENNEEETDEELSAKSRATHSSRQSNKSSRKSEKIGMSPSNRYPALKNSTVVAGGTEFSGAPLSMSPIRPGEQGAPILVISTPKSNASESPKAGTVASMNVKSLTSKNFQKTPLHPSTPAPFARKRKRSITQSPMFMNVMKSTVEKAISNIVQHQERTISASPVTSVASRVSLAETAEAQQQLTSTTSATSLASIANIASKKVSSSKGLSISNPGKGKSLAMSAFDEKPDYSGKEWEDEEDDEEIPKPRCISIAFEEIQDRSKDFVPLEKRLMADPVFQAKVKIQRAKVAAQKAAAEAKKETKKKPRAVNARKKEEDNIANVATNKGNLRFYARAKVTKEALDAVHGFVGEWFDFTLDQMENFCIDESKPSLDSWEDCYKMMKRQGIVKNYMEYSGLCHELLLNDECAQLLPTSFPPEFYEWKRKAKREKK